MTRGGGNAPEYPCEVVDLADDFKSQKELKLQLDENNKVRRYWIFLSNIKWHIELRANSFECFCAYFKSPSTWGAELKFELRYHLTNSVRSMIFNAYFSGNAHHFFRQLSLHDAMRREGLTTLNVDINIDLVSAQNFGITQHNYFDLLPEQFNTHLIVEGRKIKVNKMYLSMMSPFFKAMFFGEMHSDEDSYVMPTEKFKEMVCFLRCVYPHRSPISKKSLDFLLQMADRYQCQPLVDSCELFMCAHYHEYQKKVEKCFTYVEKYSMQRLLRIVVEYVSVTQSPAELRNQPYWRDLSEKTQLTVLEHMAKNNSRRIKEIERRRGVNERRVNIDPLDDQDPPSARILEVANPIRNAEGRAPVNFQPQQQLPPPVQHIPGPHYQHHPQNMQQVQQPIQQVAHPMYQNNMYQAPPVYHQQPAQQHYQHNIMYNNQG